jgi:hypothetical protein
VLIVSFGVSSSSGKKDAFNIVIQSSLHTFTKAMHAIKYSVRHEHTHIQVAHAPRFHKFSSKSIFGGDFNDAISRKQSLPYQKLVEAEQGRRDASLLHPVPYALSVLVACLADSRGARAGVQLGVVHDDSVDALVDR